MAFFYIYNNLYGFKKKVSIFFVTKASFVVVLITPN